MQALLATQVRFYALLCSEMFSNAIWKVADPVRSIIIFILWSVTNKL